MSGIIALALCIGIAVLAVLLLTRSHLLLKGTTFDGPFLAPRRGLFRKLQAEVLGEPPQLGEFLDSDRKLPNSSGTPQAPPINDSKTSDDLLSLAVAADGLWPSAEYAWTWAHVDHHLFEAVGQMTHHTIHSLADMNHAIHNWSGLNIWTGPSKHLVDSVKGHLAEWVVAGHLKAAGASVTMPEHANQAGWDMIADGHELNVKTCANASSAFHEHCANAAHANIGLVFPADAAHLPHDALHFDPTHGIDLSKLADHHRILVDDHLSQAQAAHDAYNGLDAASGHVHLHLPWITLCFASWREGSLLLNAHTDVSRAVKNVALTTAGVGVGGMIGSRAGAAIGTCIAPGIGTLLGTLVGGIAGGMGGREMANNIRVQPLHEAKAAYDQAIAAFREAQAHVVASADAQWATFYAATDEWLREEGLRCEIEADEAIRAAQRALQNAKSLAPARVKEALDAAEDELRPYVEQAHSQWHEIAIWRRWVWPTQNDLLVYNRYRHLRRDFALWQAARRKFEKRQRQRRASVEDALDLMLVAKCARNAAINYTKRCGIARVSAVAAIEKVRQAATTGIAAARATAVKKLQTQQEIINEWVKSELSPSISRATESQAHLIVEMRKAGMGMQATG